MKTAASVKYAKLSRKNTVFTEYSELCRQILDLVGEHGIRRSTEEIRDRNCYVLISSNRGFCGGFNNELFRFFSQKTAEESEPLVICCGRKAARYCEDRNIPMEILELPDIPSYEDAERLTEKVLEIYTSGQAEQICFICQKYVNMMTQTPICEQILPGVLSSEKKPAADILFLPDAESVEKNIAFYCLCSRVYGILLSHFSGAQAATLIAMRNACDNAEESAAALSMTINRIRQAEVTNSVIETSSGTAFRKSEN